jgi:hypothetical protein
MRVILPIATLLMLAACATPESATRKGLMSAGIDRRTAACMASRMVDRLSLAQLRRLAALGKADRARDLGELMYRLRSLKDPEIVSVTTSSAALCATGLAR